MAHRCDDQALEDLLCQTEQLRNLFETPSPAYIIPAGESNHAAELGQRHANDTTTFHGFNNLPTELQERIWRTAGFSSLGDVAPRWIRINIRVRPQYHSKRWTSPWWTYPRTFEAPHITLRLQVTLPSSHETGDFEFQRQQGILAGINRATRDSMHEGAVPLQLDNGPIIWFRPDRDAVFLDMVSLFCLWQYQHTAPADRYQESGYSQIRIFGSDAMGPNVPGIRELRFQNRRPLRGLEEQAFIGRLRDDPLQQELQARTNAIRAFGECYFPYHEHMDHGRHTRYRWSAQEMLFGNRRHWVMIMGQRFFDGVRDDDQDSGEDE